MGGKYRATGNPRGRPRKIPYDIDVQIMRSLRKRVNPETGLVRPGWKLMARELGVSRSTIARELAKLYTKGEYERVIVRTSPKWAITYYRLKGEHA